jgi:hypothetical protein
MTTVVATQTIHQTRCGLDPQQYSAYKYGAASVVAAYAQDLADLICDQTPRLASDQLTITAPGSRSVPIGADLLADGVLARLNHRRTLMGRPPAVRAKLHRHAIPAGDYGAQDLAGRQALLAQEKITTIPSLIADRDVLVIDDLWVTGLSAEVTVQAIERLHPASLTYVVIARVEPDYAAAYAAVERDLNHARVSDLDSLSGLFHQDQVIMTQRLCKFVLVQPIDQLATWLPRQPVGYIWELYCALLAEGFGLMPEYKSAFSCVASHVEATRLDIQAMSLGWEVPA